MQPSPNAPPPDARHASTLVSSARPTARMDPHGFAPQSPSVQHGDAQRPPPQRPDAQSPSAAHAVPSAAPSAGKPSRSRSTHAFTPDPDAQQTNPSGQSSLEQQSTEQKRAPSSRTTFGSRQNTDRHSA